MSVLFIFSAKIQCSELFFLLLSVLIIYTVSNKSKHKNNLRTLIMKQNRKYAKNKLVCLLLAPFLGAMAAPPSQEAPPAMNVMPDAKQQLLANFKDRGCKDRHDNFEQFIACVAELGTRDLPFFERQLDGSFKHNAGRGSKPTAFTEAELRQHFGF